MKTTISPIQQERLDDLRKLSNHGGRDQWHGLRCHHIRNGQFTATYSDIAARWGVKPSVVYSTIKRFVKLGLIATERFERATLFTLVDPSDQSDQSDQSDRPDSIGKPRIFKDFKDLKQLKYSNISKNSKQDKTPDHIKPRPKIPSFLPNYKRCIIVKGRPQCRP